VRDVAAFLATTTMRVAINVSQSAHARRDTHIGLWHFDRVDAAADPCSTPSEVTRSSPRFACWCTLVAEGHSVVAAANPLRAKLARTNVRRVT
jgi:hypothetical protein